MPWGARAFTAHALLHKVKVLLGIGIGIGIGIGHCSLLTAFLSLFLARHVCGGSGLSMAIPLSCLVHMHVHAEESGQEDCTCVERGC